MLTSIPLPAADANFEEAVDDGEEESRRSAEQQHAGQRFQRAHQPPTWVSAGCGFFDPGLTHTQRR
jgi:hypothetical protein